MGPNRSAMLSGMEAVAPPTAGPGRAAAPAARPAVAPFPVIDFDIEAVLGAEQPDDRQLLDSLLQAPPAAVPARPARPAPVWPPQTSVARPLSQRELQRARQLAAALPRLSASALPPGLSRAAAYQAMFHYVLAQQRSSTDGNTLIHKLAARGDVRNLVRFADLMVLFRDEGNIHTRNWRGETPLHLAATPQVVDALLKRGARRDARDALGNTPIHVAARHQRVDVLHALLERLFDVTLLDQKNLEGYTALHLVVIHQPLEEPHRRALQLLLDASVDVNVADDTGGRSPLFHAVLRGDEPTVRELVEANAAVNMADFSETTPLQAAEDLLPPEENHICSILLERGGFKLPPADRVTQSVSRPQARRTAKRPRQH